MVESNESSSQPGNTLDEDIELPEEDIELPDEDDDAADDDEWDGVVEQVSLHHPSCRVCLEWIAVSVERGTKMY